MGRWLYAYLFPASNTKLNSLELFVSLEKLGFEYERNIIVLDLDEDGHCLEGERKEGITFGMLEEMLLQGQAFQVSFRNDEVYGVCSFAVTAANPHIIICGPAKKFEDLPEEKREAYCLGVRQIGFKARAAYIAIMEEVPDFFEDRFVLIDDRRVIDFYLPSGRMEGVHQVLVNHELGGHEPQGIEFYPAQKLDNGYDRYIPKI